MMNGRQAQGWIRVGSTGLTDHAATARLGQPRHAATRAGLPAK